MKRLQLDAFRFPLLTAIILIPASTTNAAPKISIVSLLRGGNVPLLTRRARFSLWARRGLSDNDGEDADESYQIAAVGTGKFVLGSS